MANIFSHWLRPSHFFYVGSIMLFPVLTKWTKILSVPLNLQLSWILLNGLLFWNSYRSYKGQPRYYYLHEMLGVRKFIVNFRFNKKNFDEWIF